MSYKFLCCLVTAWFFHSASYALDLPTLPFLGNKTDVNIELAGDKTLLTVLKEELARQRQNNRQLQLYTTRRKIARYESQLLNERLRAQGYYAAEVRVDLRDERIVYQVDPGPIYRVRKLVFQAPDSVGVLHDVVTLKPGEPLRAEAVLADKKALTTYVADNFCLYRIDVDYRVVIEHQTQFADVTFVVEDSPSVRFGDITITGLESIDEQYLRARLPIKKGECFKLGRIDTTRLTLIQTNLLVSVNAQVMQPDSDSVPITLHVAERHHRRVSAGVGFESDEGFGVSAGWEHRNLMGRAQRLTIDSHIAQNAQVLSAGLTLPHYRRNDQSVTFYTDLERENTDAFQSDTGALGAEISRQLTRNLRASVGGELAFSQVEEDGLDDSFALLSLPLSLKYDRRNDPLDPRRGWVAAGSIRPYWDAYDTGTKFVKSTIAASAYFSFDEFFWRPTLAIRAAMGAISGITRDQVPANVRFYTGGGGSVRGYPFQTLGPLTDNEPDGGLSFTELSVETRLRWGEHWGGVVFVDGGFAYEENVPQFGQDLRWGAGIGLRYYTSFAPIRFDIAAPLGKREGIDDNYQLYISIGQAF
ncbi:autotransporter assembly complex protein TamA [Teredinibacter purpureus]|uniref:autotransporter assembly complex protein TamA n=1 Tax=Teredinibacter purpureus TaxID=2731756 RepID=UPI000698931F|nr:autotransporter assembly complex family protein [Teredinibacter purpureus]